MRIMFVSTVIIGTFVVWPVFFLKNIKKLYYRFFFFGIFGLFFIIDRLTKIVVVSNMHLKQTFPVIDKVLHITYIQNPGAAFGLFPHKRLFLIIVAVVSVVLIFYFAFSRSAQKLWTQVALGSLLGGALGNLFDRFLYGYVIDFIDFRVINFPVFNFADVVIDIGIFMLFFEILFFDDEKKEKKHEADTV